MAEKFLINKKFEVFCSAFVLSSLVSPVFLGRFSLGLWFFLIAVSILFLNIFLFRKAGNLSVLLIVFILGISLGFIRYDLKDREEPNAFLNSKSGQEISFEGRVVSEAEQRETKQRLLVEIEKVGEEQLNQKNKILVWAPIYPRVSFGDSVLGSGELKRPANFITDTGTVFDYEKYLKKSDIFFEINSSDIEVLEKSSFSFRKSLYSVKNLFLAKINNLIREPESSLLAGMLFGVKNSLGDSLENLLRDVGLVHIIVLSGYNITIVAEAFTSFFSLFSIRLARVFAGVGIVLFSVMVGLTPTVMRASIMALLVILARSSNRNYDISRAFALTAFLMVFWDPYIARFDPSFQLSFIATAGIIWVAPYLEKYLSRVTAKFHIRETLSATLATQLCVLPLIAYISGKVSLVALPINILVLPLIPFIMFFGFITGVVSVVSGVLALPFALLSQFLLSYIFAISKVFGSLPLATVKIPSLNIATIFFIYLVASGVFVLHKNKIKPFRFFRKQKV